MPQHILIGVGGSGQHVVHAYLRLLALSFPSIANVPRIFIIDADAAEGEGQNKRSTLIGDIIGLYNSLMSGEKTPSRVVILKPYREPESGEANTSELGELLGINGDKSLHALSHAFLADDPGVFSNDRTIRLTQGMMSNPKVGSTAIVHKIHTSLGLDNHEEEMRQWGDLFRLLREGDDLRVAAVGSNFGGTGSGVIPALMRQIDKLERVGAARAFLCLPWFSIEGGDGQQSAARNQAGLDPKARNAALGLHTYAGELAGTGGRMGEALNRTDYVLCQSMEKWPPERREDDGNFDQLENRHVINLVQAAAIQAFLGLPLQQSAKGGVFSIKASGGSQEARGLFAANTSANMRFWVRPNDSRQLSDLAADAEAATFAMATAGEVLWNVDNGDLRLGDKLNDLPGLERFLLALSRAQGKQAKPPNKVWGRKRPMPKDEVYRDLGAALGALATGIRSSLLWLDGHSSGGHQAKTVAGVDISTLHLFLAPNGNSNQADPKKTDPKQTRAEGPEDRQLKRVWDELAVEVKNAHGDSMSESPVRNQAFMLFDEIMRDVPSAAGRDPVGELIKSFENELAHSDTNQSPPTVAARVVARALHARTMVAREAARAINEKPDAIQAKRSNDGAPMLRLGLNGTAVDDCRLVRLDLTEEVMGKVEDLDPDHPMTLAYFDPYSSLNAGTGDTISFAKYTFPEHGLRGIPNIAAPQLLQRWRMEKCRVDDELERFGKAYADIKNTRRATRAGIYLHARRINEAAIWLLVSADARVQVERNLFNRENEGKAFARLLRDELRLRDGEPLTAIVFSAESKEHAGKPIFLWGGDTWFLAANVAARTFFAELLPKLPTVRHRYAPNNPLKRQDPDTLRAEPMDGFFADQIERAVRMVRSALAKVSNDKTEPAFRLRLLLQDILEELPQPTPGITDEHLGEPIALALRTNEGTNRTLSFASHKMVSKLKDFFCEQVYVFLDTQQKPNGMLPIKADAWAMLNGGTSSNGLEVGPVVDQKRDAATLELRNVDAMHLSIAGLGPFVQEKPFGIKPLQVVQQELIWSFGIWPKFKAPGWSYYVISGSSRLGDPDVQGKKAIPRCIDVEGLKEGMPVELVVLGRAPNGSLDGEGKLRELGSVKEGLPWRVNGIPEVLELRVNGKTLGTCPLDLQAPRPGDRPVHMLGVDFGTSNTCVAVQTVENDPKTRYTVPLLPGGSFHRDRVELFNYLDSSHAPTAKTDFLALAAAFFYIKNDTVQDDAADTLPSELLVTLATKPDIAQRQKAIVKTVYQREHPLIDIGDSMLGLAHDYPFATPLMTPLPPQPFNMTGERDQSALFHWLLDMCQSQDERLVGDLKWLRTDKDADTKRSRARRALYLEQTLVTAMAVLRSLGFTSFDRFVATQPEALSRINNDFAEIYGPDLHNIVEELSRRTGMHWGARGAGTPTRVLLVSETVAAIRSIGAAGVNTSVLTIDVGGGTTDVGINLNNGVNDGDRLRYTASAQFAGNNLLKALGNLPYVRTSLVRRSSASDLSKDELAERLRELSADAAKALLKADLRGRSRELGSSQTAELAEMFFDAIFEYAFRALNQFLRVHPDWLEQFLADTGSAQRFEVALFGNGFKLFKAFQKPGNGTTLEGYCNDVKKRLVEVGLLPKALADRIVTFTMPKPTKTELIRSGGMDAAADGDLLEKLNDEVLIPAGLISRATEGEPLVSDKPQLIAKQEFEKTWMGTVQSNVATRQLTLDPKDGSIRRQFPLTYKYWKQMRKEADLGDVFASKKDLAKKYIDTGALYLSERETLDGRSFSWLMSEFAKGPK